MTPDDAIAVNGRIADRLIHRLRELEPDRLSHVTVPETESDPYLGAVLSAEDCIRFAGKGDLGATARMRDALSRMDAAIDSLPLPLPIGELARNAVRGILVSSMPGKRQLHVILYAPFEPLIHFTVIEAEASTT